MTFRDPVSVGAGFEPSIDIDSKGTIYVTAANSVGTVTPEHPASGLWRSDDHGKTFQTMHDLVDVAPGTDPLEGLEGDLAVDGQDRLYFADTWLIENHFYRYSNHGKKLDFVRPALPTAFTDDRPWLAAHHDGFVYLAHIQQRINPPHVGASIGIHRSTDGGLTFDPVGFTPPKSHGLGFVDADPDSGYVYAVTLHVPGLDAATPQSSSLRSALYAYVSPDRGRTWTEHKIGDKELPHTNGDQTGSNDGFPTVAVSPKDDSVYVFWSEGNKQLKLARSRDHGRTWKVFEVTPFDGLYGYPWMSVGPTGDVGMVFTANPTAVKGDEWYVYGMVWRAKGSCRDSDRGKASRCRGPASAYGRLTPTPFPDGYYQFDFFQVEFSADNALNVPFRSPEGDVEGLYGMITGEPTMQVVYTRQTSGPNVSGGSFCGITGAP
ncbi:MAG: glycoside hydrolase [Actinomycetota bacterium]|nr:glycoside hydrolase [Actinomycetota bacterium]